VISIQQHVAVAPTNEF